MPGDAIAVEALSKTFKSKGVESIVAVNRLTFSVKRGEVFGLLGPNGSGKTTTVRMLTTLSRPSSGSAKILGVDVGKAPLGVRRRIGIVPETSNIYDEYSPLQNLTFSARLYGLSTSESRIRAERLLKEFGLWERRASIAQTFSKGMKRRLCFAMGLIHEPEVLFLDEPMSGLDVESRVLLRERIQGLRASGVTIFLTTHDMHDAELLSDRVAIILRGKLKAINTPEVLRKQLTSVVTVSVELKGSLNGAELGIIRGVIEPPKIDDHGRWNLKTKNPEVVIPEILRFATERSLLVPWIQTLEPSLEDVFLNLVSSDVHPSSKKLTV